jgi:hypothetical protein
MQRIRSDMLRGHLSEPLCQRCMGRVEEVGSGKPRPAIVRELESL